MKSLVLVCAVLTILLAGCEALPPPPATRAPLPATATPLPTPTNPAVMPATLTTEAQSTKTREHTQLEATVWVLRFINGEPVLPDVQVTIELSVDTHTFRGYTGCNQYGGPYEIKEQKFDIIEVEMSARDCLQEDLMAQERRYTDILWDVTVYIIEDKNLTLKTDAEDTLVFMLQ